MADITDVYVRIKYKKNGKIYEDDLLEDIDMYDALPRPWFQRSALSQTGSGR